MRPVTVVVGVFNPPVGRIVSTLGITPTTAGVVNEITLDWTEAALLLPTTL